MKPKKILLNSILTIFTLLIAYITLLYPIVNQEIAQNDFSINIKKFEYTSELKQRDINQSIIKAQEALNHNLYDAGSPFKAISFKDAWKTSSPSFFTYIKNKKNNLYSNTSHEFLVQTLGILYDLIIAHKYTNNNRFLLKGYQIINDWYSYNNRFYPFQSSLVWNDHVSAERILAILSFNDYASQFITLNNKDKKLIEDIVKKSILFLASPYNYKPKHNHGIYEDFALMISASYLHKDELRNKYFNLAVSRFEKQVLETFDSKGVHLENSPKYDLIITDLLNDFVKYSKKLNLTINSEVLRRINLANKNKYFFVLNNGHIPPVGDSPYVPYNNFLKLNNDVLVSQDGGYVIFKDKTSYLLIRTQSISHVHAHQDQLSYIYEDQKHLIVSDPGFLDYSSAKENVFLHSQQAHNTIYMQNNKMRKSYTINRILNDKQLFYCQISSLDKNISREILLDKGSKVLLVQDTIYTNGKKKIFEPLNLSKEAVKLNTKDSYQEIIMRDEQKYYISSFQEQLHIHTDILYGSKKPYFGGWTALTYKNIIPSYTLWTELNEKKNILFDRVISRTPVYFFSASNDLIELSLNSLKYRYDLNKIRKHAQQIKKSVVHDSVQESNYIIKKVKKKLAPLFYKRIKIFIYETFLILLLILLYILMGNKYTRFLFLASCTIIGLFDILVFLNT